MIIRNALKNLLLMLILTRLFSGPVGQLSASDEPLKLDRLVGKRAGDFRLRDVQTDK